MNNLVKIKELITEGFPPLWWENFDLQIENNADREQKFDEFSQEIGLRNDSIFDCLNTSVLIGEYVSIDNFEQAIEDISKALDAIPIFFPSPDAQELIQDELNIDFISSIKYSLYVYMNLFVTVKLRYEIDHRDFVFYDNTDINQKFNLDNYSDETRENLDFFFLNISVVRLDHFLTPDRPPFNQLFAYSATLRGKFAGNKFSEIVKDKCDYLISKWLLRRAQLKSAPMHRIKNNQESEIDIERDFQNDITKKWRKHIESHYEISPRWKFEISQKFDKIKNRSLSDLELSDLHVLTKYYKDVVCSLDNLRKIRQEIETRYLKSKSLRRLIDIYAYSLAYVYVVNNEFSLFLAQIGTDINQAENFYSEILQIQTSTGINNFFAQYKYLQFLTSKLKKEYNDRRALEFIAPARKIIDKCQEIFKRYKDNISWSESSYNYVFQLPFDECLVKINSSHLKNIFIASSFVLPLSKEKYKQEFEENRNDVTILKASIEVFENIEKDINSFNKMKDDIKRSEIRSMEILGVFATVITFVAGSITAFKTVDTPYQAALLMFALATSLSCFVLLLLTLNRGKKRLKSSINIILGFLFVAALCWWALIHFNTAPSNIQPMCPSPKETVIQPKL